MVIVTICLLASYSHNKFLDAKSQMKKVRLLPVEVVSLRMLQTLHRILSHVCERERERAWEREREEGRG
jgi:hypothetical protein